MTQSFETRISRLEEIVSLLEQDDVGLDASLKLFEEGIEVLRAASAELEKAEGKVKMLIERADGSFELRGLDL
ncbi:MAG TPA: exodeoxyribonuclease VII small subunit [Gemmatimonadaceae bacterium]|nr:exodeoxyribonuclease VII small subunit [Gemmatimonadaceae bacterium]